MHIEHPFAECPSFKHTKQSPFLRAEVSEIKKHLFDECFEPQNSHDVVLLLFTKDLPCEYSADEKISRMKIRSLVYQQMM